MTMTANDLLITLRTHHRTMAGYLADVEAGRTVKPNDITNLGDEIAKYTRLYQERVARERIARLSDATAHDQAA